MDSKTLPNKGTQKGDMPKTSFSGPFWQKRPAKTTFSSIFHGLQKLSPAHSRTMKGDLSMEKTLRADFGQSQEPPPDDRGRSTEEDDLMTFDEYLLE